MMTLKKLAPYFDFKVNLTTIITLAMLIISWSYGFGRFQGKVENIQSEHQILADEVHKHFQIDEGRFAALATKETRAARDKEVDGRFDAMEKTYKQLLERFLEQQREINRRLSTIERMHMKP